MYCDSKEEIEPEGVNCIRRFRDLIGVVASIDQDSDTWNGVGSTDEEKAKSAAANRQALYQPLAMSILWPITSDLVDHLDDAGKLEMENLRTIISNAVKLLGKHLNPTGSRSSVQGRSVGADITHEIDGDHEEPLSPRIANVLAKIDVRIYLHAIWFV